MEVIMERSAQSAAQLAAEQVACQITKNPQSVLGLATGRTMEPVYAKLCEFHEKYGLDFSQVRTFNLDEYVGLPSDHEQSYRTYMNNHLFNRVNIDLTNTRVPNGMADDLEAECQRYENEIKESGGLDLQLLGIGRSGHIGFNEPSAALYSRTRVEVLTRVTLMQNGPLFGGSAKMPHHAITMGIATILEARKCIMLVTGTETADVLAKAIEGPVTATVPASVLQFHPRVTVVLDSLAAVNLSHKEYYRWAQEQKLDWQRVQYPPLHASE
ncbi:MAG: glucosamine-6-phosphate deaminase [Candidatus Pacebacteria bacterium]|nr:glucosamine-6-phosphate deaminase [Candidatus Paceibacterota bacterium]